MTPAGAATVFIIDDDASVRESIQDLLESLGLRSESFGTAEEFLRSKRPEGPSCLVLDVRLPESMAWTFRADWSTPVSKSRSFSSPAMETFR